MVTPEASLVAQLVNNPPADAGDVGSIPGLGRSPALISQTSKVMLNVLQARLLQYINHELPDVQTGFRKGR